MIRRCDMTLLLIALAVGCMPAAGSRPSFPVVPLGTPVYEWRNGRWYNGATFDEGTRYTVYGVVTRRRPVPVDSVIDLHGAFVIPALGEAHNHNGGLPHDTALVARYLREGIYYVENPNNAPEYPRLDSGFVNVPSSIDVAFANGSLTAPGGHPAELIRRNIARGIATEADGEGRFFFSVANEADLERVWPLVLAQHSDLLKTYLLFSEEYERRRGDSTFFGWRGLDPALLPSIVRRAHAARLRVATHVETAADFRAAIRAGVDQIAHLPGFRPEGGSLAHFFPLERYRLNVADANDAARRKVVVVTTVSGSLEYLASVVDGAAADSARAVREMIISNLHILQSAGVPIALGSDRFRADVATEVATLRKEHVFTDSLLLHMWAVTTPQAIFPSRRIGSLEDAAEASFVVVPADPSRDLDQLRLISIRVKGGHILAMQR